MVKYEHRILGYGNISNNELQINRQIIILIILRVKHYQPTADLMSTYQQTEMNDRRINVK
jgi:hypothetical protein